MQKILMAIAIVILCSFSIAHAQSEADDSTPTEAAPTSKLGQFYARKGVLIREEKKLMATIQGKGHSTLTVTAVAAYDVSNQQSARIDGFRLFFYDERKDHGDRPEYALIYIDREEAENLIKGLFYMAQQGETWKGKKVGEKTIRFVGTDNYTFYLDHSSDTKTQIFSAYAGVYPRVRFTFKGADWVLGTRNLLREGLTWASQQ